MPLPFHAHGIRAVAHLQSEGDDVIASPALWTALKAHMRFARRRENTEERDEERIGISVQWREDRRLGKGKAKSVVAWVIQAEERVTSAGNLSEPCLYLPARLVPPYSPTPTTVQIHLHDPTALSLVILQPIIAGESDSDSTILSSDDLDLSGFYANFNAASGTANGDPSSRGSTIVLREGESVAIPLRHSHPHGSRRFNILMVEPVQQGVLTPATRIIVSTAPYTALNGVNGDPFDAVNSESSSTHVSLDDFDPDAFLSSPLGLSLSQRRGSSDGSPTLGNGHLALSISSGSITPTASGTRVMTPPASATALANDLDDVDVGGTRFNAVRAMGPSSSSRREDEDVCWVAVSGLGRAGIFEGDWAFLKTTSNTNSPGPGGQLVRVLAWERLDEDDDELPANPILIAPHLYRALFPTPSTSSEVLVQPPPFGARRPTLPIARTITLARIATTEGVDKRYERSWLRELKAHFSRKHGEGEDSPKLIRRGDIISVPIRIGRPVESGDSSSSSASGGSDSDDEESSAIATSRRGRPGSAVAYFVVTALSYEPLVPLEEDFRSSVSSKARAGELGCWIDVGEQGSTKMVLTGVERARVTGRDRDRSWHNIPRIPPPFSVSASTNLRNLLASCFSHASLAYAVQLSVLIQGARGSGKMSMIRSLADDIGFNIVLAECYDIVEDTPAFTEGTLKAAVDKAKACAPSILLLSHVEALSRKSEAAATGRASPIVKVLEDVVMSLKAVSAQTGWPCVLLGTTADEDAVPAEVLGCFKQNVKLSAPNEAERLAVAREVFRPLSLAPDVSVKTIAIQTAALQPADILSLSFRARDIALARAISSTGRRAADISRAGLTLMAADVDAALADARSSYSDSIGAPRIPNVGWDDVGGLASVKKEILETIQLPLERPELFAEGLKKRSGILLYGPPGTGKTLLAKAVATSCSLNFFSIKGPELLNMYIGESEANVRRVFQRARDAQPCVIFMDELDSVAPKRGNQGDSGGVMDRIVSQLLAELDGMSGGQGGDVYIMGATNRPDLLDPALLRPGRFDRMLYLSVPTTHDAQLGILLALTRKFALEPALDLVDIAEQCPFNYTGADFYALCSDAMLRAMTRKAKAIDGRIAQLDAMEGERAFPHPLTPQYYLASMATAEEIEVRVSEEDFEESLGRLVPSVSRGEMEHYERVQREFKGFAINGNGE